MVQTVPLPSDFNEKNSVCKIICVCAAHLCLTLCNPTDCSPSDSSACGISHARIPNGLLGRNDAKAETPVLWPPHAKSLLIGKDSDAGKDWGQEEKGTTEDGMAGWHH